MPPVSSDGKQGILNATRLLKVMRGGSSMPLLVAADDGRRYVAKASGAEGVVSHLCEWLGAGLGALAGLPVLQPVLMNTAALRGMDPEINDTLGKSTAISVATGYLRDAVEFRSGDLSGTLRDQADAVFLYDLLLLNVDRTVDNPNMLADGNGFQCLDYSTSLEIRRWFGATVPAGLTVLRRLRVHPFYRKDISVHAFRRRLAAIPRQAVEHLVAMIPAQWRPPGQRHDLLQCLSRLTVAADLQRRLDSVRVLQPAMESGARPGRAAAAS